MHDMEIGGQPFNTNISTVMADTGTSLNMIPDEDFNPIMEKFVYSQGMECYVMPNTLTACDCTEDQYNKVPDINFKIEGD